MKSKQKNDMNKKESGKGPLTPLSNLFKDYSFLLAILGTIIGMIILNSL